MNATSANLAPKHASPFELVLSTGGDDFAVMGMHFKLGLYEHQSAGALQGLIDLLACPSPTSPPFPRAPPLPPLRAAAACAGKPPLRPP